VPGSPLPSGIEDRGWYTLAADGTWLVGTAAGSERLELPESELPIAVDVAYVATDAAVGDTRRLRIYEIATGRLIVDVTPTFGPVAVFVEDELLVSGWVKPDGIGDPGVVGYRLSDGSAAALVPASDQLPQGLAGGVSRTVVASPTGRTLVTPICSPALGCVTQVVDMVTRTTRATKIPLLEDRYPVFATDDVVLYMPGEVTFTIDAYDIATGQALWSRSGDEILAGYVTSDAMLILELLTAPRTYAIERVDPRSGHTSVIDSRPRTKDVTLWPELSSDTIAVIGPAPRITFAQGLSATVKLDLLDLSTGEYTADAWELSIRP
jgi:hypothetical protein